ncbi:MAG: VCBS repeat-containing protein, partial [Nitrospirales bacterium]|nr:VCBS repeat-containing protein [Nitrospirales bacterium]
IAGVGDVNGNGTDDIVWRHASSGAVAVWFMNGATITSTGFPGSVSLNWVIRQVGDFNGDGKADLFWHNTGSGTVAVWLMNGATITSTGYPATTSLDWQIQ